MTELKLSEKQEELIEKFGVQLEMTGLPPAQARVAGLLVICDRTELTFDEIKDLLKLSKSATSNAINSLLRMGRIKYHTKLGDRKRYFTSKIGGMEEDFKEKIGHILKLKMIFTEVLESRTPETKEFNNKLKGLVDFIDFMQTELPRVYEAWKQQQD